MYKHHTDSFFYDVVLVPREQKELLTACDLVVFRLLVELGMIARGVERGERLEM